MNKNEYKACYDNIIKVALTSVKGAIAMHMRNDETFRQIWNFSFEEKFYALANCTGNLTKEEHNLINAYYNLLKIVNKA